MFFSLIAVIVVTIATVFAIIKTKDKEDSMEKNENHSIKENDAIDNQVQLRKQSKKPISKGSLMIICLLAYFPLTIILILICSTFAVIFRYKQLYSCISVYILLTFVLIKARIKEEVGSCCSWR